MGAPTQASIGTSNVVSQASFTYTATQSKFVQNAGPVQLTVTFMSPIEPNDLKRLSLPFSYMQVQAQSTDGNSHSVQIYSDISAEWAAGDRSQVANWNYSNSVPLSSGNLAVHTVQAQNQQLFSEAQQQAQWGQAIYATANGQGLSYMSGADVTVRSTFVGNGSLPNTSDSQFRAINNNYPVFGFAQDLGQVSGPSATYTYVVGLARDPAVQYATTAGTVPLSSLWKSYFSDANAALSFFYDDASTAFQTANAFDQQVQSDSVRAGGQDYATITTLAARQAFGGTELVGTADKPFLFLKEISSDGNVQTVDVIFPFHPILLYTSSTLLKLLLDPLFELQESGLYPNTYSMHDLGSNYPNATGHPDGKDEYMPVEECGNMLYMTSAYAAFSGDVGYLKQHYNILKQWTQYLIEFGEFPGSQVSTDDFAGAAANQTNLALKGIIGVGLMGQIANLTGNTADAQNYSSIAASYIAEWQQVAKDSSGTHYRFAYNNDSTWSTLYNLYGDMITNLNLVPQDVYTLQESYYATVMQKYGLPLDSRHTYTKADWQIFAASVAKQNSTVDSLVHAQATWINETPTNTGYTDWYDTISGDFGGGTFIARPVIGGTFAILAMERRPNA